jgi:hypothetical protein
MGYYGITWDNMGLSDTYIKWQNKHRVVVISVCYLSILFTELPEIYQNKSEKSLDISRESCIIGYVLR